MADTPPSATYERLSATPDHHNRRVFVAWGTGPASGTLDLTAEQAIAIGAAGHALQAALDPADPIPLGLIERCQQLVTDAADRADRHQPLTDEPCGHVPTQRGLDYLAIRRQQHPKGDPS